MVNKYVYKIWKFDIWTELIIFHFILFLKESYMIKKILHGLLLNVKFIHPWWDNILLHFALLNITQSFFIWKSLQVLQKSLHQDRGPYCLQLPIFLLYIQYPLLLENVEVVMIVVFLSKLDHRSLFNDIYYRNVLVWGLVSVWLTNATHCP